MPRISVKRQIHNNMVAIISLVVAITAISYTTWRSEKTERNRNVRPAAFEVLNQLGQLQLVVNSVRYRDDNQGVVNPIIGWGHVSFVSDLSQILPPPIPVKIAELVHIWGDTWETIRTNEADADKITHQIDSSRALVLKQLKHLQ